MVAGARRNMEGRPPVLVLQLKVGTVAHWQERGLYLYFKISSNRYLKQLSLSTGTVVLLSFRKVAGHGF
jgi:hypothetical protein